MDKENTAINDSKEEILSDDVQTNQTKLTYKKEKVYKSPTEEIRIDKSTDIDNKLEQQQKAIDNKLIHKNNIDAQKIDDVEQKDVNKDDAVNDEPNVEVKPHENQKEEIQQQQEQQTVSKEESNHQNKVWNDNNNNDEIQTNQTKPILIKEAFLILFQTYYYKMKKYHFPDYQVFVDGIKEGTIADITDKMIKEWEDGFKLDDNKIKKMCEMVQDRDTVNKGKNEMMNIMLNFPTNTRDQNNTFIQIKTFGTINSKYLRFIKECDFFQLNQTPKHLSTFNWSNITELVHLYFYPKLAQKLKQIVHHYDTKLLQEITEQIGLFHTNNLLFFPCNLKQNILKLKNQKITKKMMESMNTNFRK